MEGGGAPDGAIAAFCGITGANQHVAEQYLSCMNNDVERAVNFYFENPPDAGGGPPAAGGADMTEADARAAAAAFDEEDVPAYADPPAGNNPIDLTGEAGQAGPAWAHAGAAGAQAHAGWAADEDMEDEEEMLRSMAAQRDAAIRAARESERMMEEMMTATRNMPGMAGSMLFPNLEGVPPGGGLGVSGRRVPVQARGQGHVRIEEVDDDDEEVGGGARGSGRAGPAAQEDADEALARRLMEEEEGLNAYVAAGGSGHGGRFGAAGVGAEAGAGPGVGGGEEDEHAALGLGQAELEEARMMEAAMLGIPYEPRLPPRVASASAAAGPLRPEVREARGLRYEQDAAYEESLAADRAKAQAAEAAARAAEEAARKEREESEAAERAAAAEAARIAAALEAAAAALPPEPPAGEGVVNVMVRMPDGGRQGRRFKTSDPLQAVFNFVDVQHQAASLKPGTYSLVTSYPRKVLPPGTKGSLADAGITADTALFIEAPSS